MSKLLTQIPVRHFVDEALRQDKDGWAIKTQLFTIGHTRTQSRSEITIRMDSMNEEKLKTVKIREI